METIRSVKRFTVPMSSLCLSVFGDGRTSKLRCYLLVFYWSYSLTLYITLSLHFLHSSTVTFSPVSFGVIFPLEHFYFPPLLGTITDPFFVSPVPFWCIFPNLHFRLYHKPTSFTQYTNLLSFIPNFTHSPRQLPFENLKWDPFYPWVIFQNLSINCVRLNPKIFRVRVSETLIQLFVDFVFKSLVNRLITLWYFTNLK